MPRKEIPLYEGETVVHQVDSVPEAGRGIRFRCYRCSVVQNGFRQTCAQCTGTVLAELDPLGSKLCPRPEPGLWRWRELLPRSPGRPLPERSSPVGDISLGEGNTPLVPLPRHQLPHSVFLKLESLNPTLSFKDRAMALGVSWGRQLDVPGLVVASTGNAAVSASAYAAAAGIQCRVIVGTGSGAGRKVEACRRHGAEIHMVEGDYSTAYAEAAGLEQEGWFNVSTTYRNPVLAEAYRTLALELLEQSDTVPDAIVVPIGAGPLLRGIGQGFADAAETGAVTSVPELVGVQAAAVAPVARRWELRERAEGAALVENPIGPTAAGAIADPLRGYEEHAEITLDAVEKSGGTVVAVDEVQIAEATSSLASQGYWVEPSSATALAALSSPSLRQRFGDGPRRIILMMTGHGSKVD